MSVDKQLEKLLGTLVDDRTCDEAGSAFRGGCTECERFSNKGVGAARRFFRDEKTGAALAAALLRARKVLATCADYENCVCHEPCPDEKGVRCLGGLLVEALADPELEEVLR